MTFPAHGHYMTLRDVGVALRLRGHDVTFVLCEGSRKTFEADKLGELGIRFLSAGACELYYRQHDDVMRALLEKETLETVSAVLDGVAELSHEMCTAVMPLYAAAARIKTANASEDGRGLLPDVLVFDADTFCAQDLAIRFRIPRVARVGTGPRDAFSSPVYVPQYGNAVPLAMSPMQRIGNAVSLLLSRLLISPMVLPRLAAKHRFDPAYAALQPSAQQYAEVAQALGDAWSALDSSDSAMVGESCSLEADGQVACDGARIASHSASVLSSPPPVFPLDVFHADVPWDGAPVLYNSHWGLEHARPLHPFEHMVGHTTDFRREEARPIPPAIAAWLQASPLPVVYVGLGTLGILAPEYLAALGTAMHAASCCRFLWAVPEAQQSALSQRARSFSHAWLQAHVSSSSASEAQPASDLIAAAGAAGQILLVPWVPQLAVLRHASVSAFWTHGGMNGVAEGTYAHTPMLCMPLFSDQPDNCQRIADRGMGLRLDRNSIVASPAAVGQALQRMLDEHVRFEEGVAAAWRANVAAGGIPRAVAIVEATAMLGYSESRSPYVPRALLRPLDTASLPTGWTAASSPADGAVQDMPMHWLQRNNLDLLAVAAVCLLVIGWAVRCCFRRCCCCCFAKRC